MGKMATTTKKKKTKPKTNIFVINKTKPEPEENLILGLKWWQFLCIVFGSVLALMFVCLCCCAIMDSAQRHEVRGNNGQRLGFFQAPGRHIILVMDNQLGRFRGNHGGADDATDSRHRRRKPSSRANRPTSRVPETKSNGQSSQITFFTDARMPETVHFPSGGARKNHREL